MVTMTDSQKLDFLVEQFIDVKKDISEMKEDIAGMKEDISEMKGNIAEIKSDIAEIKCDIAEMKDDISAMKSDIRKMHESMDRQENDLRSIREFQENVLAKSIYAIIEGQKDMIRQLDEFLVKKEQMITT